MKMFKKITAAATALVMAVGVMSFGASAYVADKDWEVSRVSGNANMTYNDTRTIAVFGKGYQTDCESISGSNNRLVHVTSGTRIDYNITTTGLSAVYPNYVIGSNSITFNFEAVGSGYCKAKGTIGYNI